MLFGAGLTVRDVAVGAELSGLRPDPPRLTRSKPLCGDRADMATLVR